MFRILPAIDLKGGKVVRLRRGREDEVTVMLDNPIDVADNWIKRGARALHLIDLDGAFRGRLRHEDVIMDIKKRFKVEMQVGGGIRDIRIARRLIENGIDRIILGTLAIRDVRSVKKLAEMYPNRIMIAVDSRRNRVAIEGWKSITEFTPVEIARIYEDCDVSILYTNIDVEGLVSGVELERIERIVRSVDLPVYVAGGITSRRDVMNIKRIGAAGVVIGSALYMNVLRLEDVIDLEE